MYSCRVDTPSVCTEMQAHVIERAAHVIERGDVCIPREPTG